VIRDRLFAVRHSIDRTGRVAMVAPGIRVLAATREQLPGRFRWPAWDIGLTTLS
jgi:hypothetical protein